MPRVDINTGNSRDLSVTFRAPTAFFSFCVEAEKKGSGGSPMDYIWAIGDNC